MDPNIGAIAIVALLGLWRIQRERRAHDERMAAERARLYRGQLPEDIQ